MNIAIDSSPLSNDHKYRGIGQYTKLLIESLRQFEPTHTYTLFTRKESIPKDADIVHYPYFDPFFLTLPIRKTKPTVVTVHDLIPIVHADHFLAGIKGRAKWLIQRSSLQSSDAVITDSYASKRDIVNHCGLTDDTVHVVSLAPSPIYHVVHRESILNTSRKKYALPVKFILYVGDVNWNKNIEGLLQAFALLKKQIRDIHLVLVGESFTHSSLPEAISLRELINTLGIRTSVHFLGYVSDEDLKSIYNLAAAYVQPSFAEGFGLPVLEALTCGTPTVVAKSSSLLEIAGPSVMVDPMKHDDIARGMSVAITLKSNSQYQSKAKTWVEKFSWEKVAHEVVNVYRGILKN